MATQYTLIVFSFTTSAAPIEGWLAGVCWQKDKAMKRKRFRDSEKESEGDKDKVNEIKR